MQAGPSEEVSSHGNQMDLSATRLELPDPLDVIHDLRIQSTENEAKPDSEWRESNVELRMLDTTLVMLKQRLFAFHVNTGAHLPDAVIELISDALLQIDTISTLLKGLLNPAPSTHSSAGPHTPREVPSPRNAISVIDHEFVRAANIQRLETIDALIGLSSEMGWSIAYFQTQTSFSRELAEDIQVLINSLSQLVLSFQKSMPKQSEALELRNKYILSLWQFIADGKEPRFIEQVLKLLKKLLALRDIDINARGNNARSGHCYLHYVAAVPAAFPEFANGLAQIIKDDVALLECMGSDHRTPLHEAVEVGNLHLVAWLRSAGIAPEGVNVEGLLDLEDKLDGGYQLPLDMALKRITAPPYTQIVQALLIKSSAVDTPPVLTFHNQQGLNPLQQATLQGQLEYIDAMLPLLKLAVQEEFHSKIDAVTKKLPGMVPKTALHIAVERGFMRCAQRLLYSGARTNIKNWINETIPKMINRIKAASHNLLKQAAQLSPQEILNLLFLQLQHARLQLHNLTISPEVHGELMHKLEECLAKLNLFASSNALVKDEKQNLNPEIIALFTWHNDFQQLIFQNIEKMLAPQLQVFGKAPAAAAPTDDPTNRGAKRAHEKRMRDEDGPSPATTASPARSPDPASDDSMDFSTASSEDAPDRHDKSENDSETKSESTVQANKRIRRPVFLTSFFLPPNQSVFQIGFSCNPADTSSLFSNIAGAGQIPEADSKMDIDSNSILEPHSNTQDSFSACRPPG